MLYRLAIVETTNHKWVVYKIRYQRLKDRMKLEHFVGDQLGVFDTIAGAAAHSTAIHALLERVANQQDIIDDRHEDEYVRLQSRSALTSLLSELTALTGIRHP